jgi:tetratricopeptide (TPR) repeat protein
MQRQGVRNAYLLAEIILLEAENSARQQQWDQALRLADTAVALAPDSPTVQLRQAVLTRLRDGYTQQSIREYLQGWSALFKDFWSMFRLITNAVTLWVVSLSGLFLVFVGYLLIRWIPLAGHTLYELFQERLLMGLAVAGVAGLTLLLPVWLGVGWGMVIWIALGWFLARTHERFLVVLLLAWVGAAGLWLPLWVHLREVIPTDGIEVVLHSQQERFLSPTTVGKISSEPAFSWRVPFALGLDAERQEDYTTAERWYETALRAQSVPTIQDQVRIFNNLGGLYYKQKRYDRALEYYQRARALDPGEPLILFNLAQLYREQLEFERGEQTFLEAKKLDAERADAYAREAAAREGVIEATLTDRDVWAEIFLSSSAAIPASDRLFQGFFPGLPIQRAPWLAGGFLIGLVLLRWIFDRLDLGADCPGCGRIICSKCQRYLFDLRLCEPCWAEVKGVKRKQDLQVSTPDWGWRRWAYRAAAVVLPGMGQFLAGSTWRGLAVGLIFWWGLCLWMGSLGLFLSLTTAPLDLNWEAWTGSILLFVAYGSAALQLKAIGGSKWP